MPKPMRFACIPLLLAASACSTLPTGAPTVSQVVGPAATSGIAVIDIVDTPTPAPGPVVPAASAWPIADAAPWSGEIAVGTEVV